MNAEFLLRVRKYGWWLVVARYSSQAKAQHHATNTSHVSLARGTSTGRARSQIGFSGYGCLYFHVVTPWMDKNLTLIKFSLPAEATFLRS